MLERFTNRLEEGIISLLLVTMTLIVTYEIAVRLMAPMLLEMGYLPDVMWTEELTMILSAWMVLLGASYGVKVGSHIGVDAVVRLLPDRTRRVVSLAAVALCLVYCGVFLYGAWDTLVLAWEINIELEDLPVPEWVAESVLLIGFVLLFYRFAQLGWSIFKGEATGFHLADEAREALEGHAEDGDEETAK